jgi:peptidoglycan/xylan/chitin deacetylase (PgdA/CDA1 family)
MSLDQERDVLEKSLELAQRFTGKRPTGYVAPWWEFSDNTTQLLLDAGVEYDHSLMHNDFLPYYVPRGVEWTPIDYNAPATEWMKPMNRGEPTSLVEIPANWYLDDLPPMMFVKKSPNSHGFVNPRDIELLWRDQFDWVYRELDYAAFTIAIHPDVSGRPQVLLMLERLIEYINGHSGVRWRTFDDICRDFKARKPS